MFPSSDREEDWGVERNREAFLEFVENSTSKESSHFSRVFELQWIDYFPVSLLLGFDGVGEILLSLNGPFTHQRALERFEFNHQVPVEVLVNGSNADVDKVFSDHDVLSDVAVRAGEARFEGNYFYGNPNYRTPLYDEQNRRLDVNVQNVYRKVEYLVGEDVVSFSPRKKVIILLNCSLIMQ